MNKILIAITCLFATAGLAQAQSPAPAPAASPVRFLIGMGVSGGGDKLATAHYEDGFDINIRAGETIYFTAGVDYRFTPEFSLQGTVNYHFDRANAKNGDIKFERFPVELIGYYQPHPSWRVGGGVRYTVSPKLSGSGAASGIDASFDNTTSAVAEAEYFVNPRFGVKLRYVNETFKARGYSDVDGSHIGVSANLYF